MRRPPPQFPSTVDTVKTRRAIIRAARERWPYQASRKLHLFPHFEHGHWWLIVRPGDDGDDRTFNVVDTTTGFDFEEV